MKKIIVSLLMLFIGTVVFAQNADKFYNVSKDSAKIIADDLAAMAQTKYELVSVNENLKNNGATFLYKDVNNNDNRLTVYFRVYNGRYNFYSVGGSFSDVFPFWKKYIQPDADADKMASQQLARVHLKSSSSYQPQITFRKDFEAFKILLQ